MGRVNADLMGDFDMAWQSFLKPLQDAYCIMRVHCGAASAEHGCGVGARPNDCNMSERGHVKGEHCLPLDEAVGEQYHCLLGGRSKNCLMGRYVL